MTELLAFFGDHWFLAWCALWLCWVPYIAYVKFLDACVAMVHGWPSRHGDDYDD
jgi:hypothetical protein